MNKMPLSQFKFQFEKGNVSVDNVKPMTPLITKKGNFKDSRRP